MKHDEITRTITRGKESDNILSDSEHNNNLDGLVRNTIGKSGLYVRLLIEYTPVSINRMGAIVTTSKTSDEGQMKYRSKEILENNT